VDYPNPHTDFELELLARPGALEAYTAARTRRVTELIAAAIEAMPGSDEGPYCRDAAALARQVGERIARQTEGSNEGDQP
jgi:hypothetical protein